MTYREPLPPDVRVAETLSSANQIKWAALQNAWRRLPATATDEEIIALANSWRDALGTFAYRYDQ